MRTQVAIIGAGPAGLLLAHVLDHLGVESVIIEDRSRAYVEARIRAGVLEQGAVESLTEYGLGDRLHREGMRHDGVYLQWPGQRRRIDFSAAGSHSVWVYGQTEITKDLIAARLAAGQPIFWETSNAVIEDVETDSPVVTFNDSDGATHRLQADYVAGCDGFHGISRESIPAALRTVHQRVYPYAWLGILADVAPSTDEILYAMHPDGFAMHSMRSPRISRLYLQVDPHEDIKNWSDDRIWSALSTRLAVDGWELKTGPTLEKSITPMRSFVNAPMRWGRMFLAGDAAHIVPPTGAKGLNLAIADVLRLARALARSIRDGKDDLIDSYSDDALRRVWQSTHFSWWMTQMLHTPPLSEPDRDFTMQMQLAQLRYVTSSPVASAGLAENYTGSVLPYA